MALFPPTFLASQVLQMNIARAQKAQNPQLERALTFLYNAVNEEIESKVEIGTGWCVAARCLW